MKARHTKIVLFYFENLLGETIDLGETLYQNCMYRFVWYLPFTMQLDIIFSKFFGWRSFVSWNFDFMKVILYKVMLFEPKKCISTWCVYVEIQCECLFTVQYQKHSINILLTHQMYEKVDELYRAYIPYHR